MFGSGYIDCCPLPSMQKSMCDIQDEATSGSSANVSSLNCNTCFFFNVSVHLVVTVIFLNEHIHFMHVFVSILLIVYLLYFNIQFQFCFFISGQGSAFQPLTVNSLVSESFDHTKRHLCKVYYLTRVVPLDCGEPLLS